VVPSISQLHPGDMVFFIRTYKTASLITHVGLYLGEGRFINANSYYGKTKIDDINQSYWKTRFLFGTRGRTGTGNPEPEEEE
jgi:cell wall-associated NlpC family hydrolase